MEVLNNFADYLWVITKIVVLFLILGAILLTILGTIFGGMVRVRKVSPEEWQELENQDKENEEK